MSEFTNMSVLRKFCMFGLLVNLCLSFHLICCTIPCTSDNKQLLFDVTSSVNTNENFIHIYSKENYFGSVRYSDLVTWYGCYGTELLKNTTIIESSDPTVLKCLELCKKENRIEFIGLKSRKCFCISKEEINDTKPSLDSECPNSQYNEKYGNDTTIKKSNSISVFKIQNSNTPTYSLNTTKCLKCNKSYESFYDCNILSVNYIIENNCTEEIRGSLCFPTIARICRMLSIPGGGKCVLYKPVFQWDSTCAFKERDFENVFTSLLYIVSQTSLISDNDTILSDPNDTKHIVFTYKLLHQIHEFINSDKPKSSESFAESKEKSDPKLAVSFAFNCAFLTVLIWAVITLCLKSRASINSSYKKSAVQRRRKRNVMPSAGTELELPSIHVSSVYQEPADHVELAEDFTRCVYNEVETDSSLAVPQDPIHEANKTENGSSTYEPL